MSMYAALVAVISLSLAVSHSDGYATSWASCSSSADLCSSSTRFASCMAKVSVTSNGKTVMKTFSNRCNGQVSVIWPPKITNSKTTYTKITIPTSHGDCKDTIALCGYWGDNGFCTREKDFMERNCPRACGKCEVKPVKPVVKPVKPVKKRQCADANRRCAEWARQGECAKNPSYMLRSCKRSCGRCNQKKVTTCVDKNRMCSTWAGEGECSINPAYMHRSCSKSCGLCINGPNEVILTSNSRCVDDNSMCFKWAGNGECRTNPNFMLKYCKNSCGVC